MNDLLRSTNTAAMVLGYLSLGVVVAVAFFIVLKLFRELIHDRRRKRFEEDEWDHVRSQWLFDSLGTDQIHQQDQHDTDIIDFPQTVEYEAVTYQEEDKHERSRIRRSRKQARR